MAKRMSFDDIAKDDFRWPTKNDQPFAVGDDGAGNAIVAADIGVRLALMIGGYKESADLMIKTSEEDQSKRDSFVFSVIFSYRQFLELSLKHQLAQHGSYVGVEANWKTHDLRELWGQFEDMLAKYGTPDPDEADLEVARIVAEFSKIDPGSYSYRYPVDQKGKALPVAHDALHLPTVADVMNGVDNYFSGCDGYLSKARKAKHQ